MSIAAPSHWRILSVSGEKAASFLQGQLCCDVLALKPNHACIGGYANIKGRLIATFYLIQRSDSLFWIYLPEPVLPILQKTLQRYALFSKVSLTALTLISSPIKAPAQSTPMTMTGDILVIDKERALSFAPSDAEPIAEESWITADIFSKKPWIFEQTSETLLPHHCGLVAAGGVSFEKGCYLGQEIIARMHYRGNIKKHPLVVCGFSSTPEPGQSIVNNEEKPVGTVLYGIHDTALAVIDDGQVIQSRPGASEVLRVENGAESTE